jgi:hypothetical protein
MAVFFFAALAGFGAAFFATVAVFCGFFTASLQKSQDFPKRHRKSYEQVYNLISIKHPFHNSIKNLPIFKKKYHT